MNAFCSKWLSIPMVVTNWSTLVYSAENLVLSNEKHLAPQIRMIIVVQLPLIVLFEGEWTSNWAQFVCLHLMPKCQWISKWLRSGREPGGKIHNTPNNLL